MELVGTVGRRYLWVSLSDPPVKLSRIVLRLGLATGRGVSRLERDSPHAVNRNYFFVLLCRDARGIVPHGIATGEFKNA